jgi:5-methyltetrahydropteroyltriglutamate--homocysteine methyltransferase
MKLLPTTLVGSYPQPDWLIDREKLKALVPPRARATELWRIAPPWLDEAQDDATLLAIRDQERAGIDVVTDGEIRRESYSNRFACALEGVDAENPAKIPARTPGRFQIVPRVTGPIRRRHSVERRDVEFLRANTDQPIRITLPGPFTLTQQVADEYYRDEAALAMDYAAAVNAEIKDLIAAGADVVQLDEPFLEARPDKARVFAVPAINRAVDGVRGTTALHLCFGYGSMIKTKKNTYSFLEELADSPVDQVSVETAQPNLDCSTLTKLGDKTIILGVLDLSTEEVETADTVAQRIRRALPHVPAERLMVAPDCGLKYMSRDAAFGKLQALVAGAATVRRELTGGA